MLAMSASINSDKTEVSAGPSRLINGGTAAVPDRYGRNRNIGG
jgi:hypothetical protein